MMYQKTEYDIRTIVGFTLILGGIIGGIGFGWWLIFVGDIIQILHSIKMSLPGWVWLLLKIGLSGILALLFIALFVLLAFAVLSGGQKDNAGERNDRTEGF
jgi:hypothetical protein